MLRTITRKGTHNAGVIKRARAILNSDAGLSDTLVAMRVETTSKTVQRVRERFCKGGIERALEFGGVGKPATLHKEELEFEYVKLATRSYK